MIDPIRTPTRRRSADTYLQLRPGSDAALAFALAHVIRRDGLLDEAFIAEHVLGYDELEPLLDACTPAWGEQQTGVPARLIEHVARALRRAGRRCSGWARGCSASRAAATSCAPSGCCPR